MTQSYVTVDEIYRAFVEREHVPGLVAGVVADGALAHLTHLGLANVEDRRPPDSKTRFRIASVSKNLTALAALCLRDDGALALEDEAAQYVPELRAQAHPSIDRRAVTLRDLLNHTSGYVTDDPWADRLLGQSPDEFSALLRAGDLNAQPVGLDFEYSNLGYAILGRVIRAASGLSYQHFVRERLLAPLGMVATSYDFPAAPAAERAAGYRWSRGAWSPEAAEPDGEFGAMGGLVTTADDYGRYVAFLLNAWPARNDPDPGPVRRSSVRELALAHGPPLLRQRRVGEALIPVASAYGYGMVNAIDARLGRYLHHLGGLPGYGSHLILFPDCGVGLFAFANRTYAPVDQATFAVADALRAAGLLTPRPRQVSPALATAADALMRAYDACDTGSLAALAAINFFPDEPAAERDAHLAALKAVFGKVHAAEVEPRHDLAGRFVLRCANGELRGEIVLTPGPRPQIQRIRFDDPT